MPIFYTKNMNKVYPKWRKRYIFWKNRQKNIAEREKKIDGVTAFGAKKWIFTDFLFNLHKECKNIRAKFLHEGKVKWGKSIDILLFLMYNS